MINNTWFYEHTAYILIRFFARSLKARYTDELPDLGNLKNIFRHELPNQLRAQGLNNRDIASVLDINSSGITRLIRKASERHSLSERNIVRKATSIVMQLLHPTQDSWKMERFWKADNRPDQDIARTILEHLESRELITISTTRPRLVRVLDAEELHTFARNLNIFEDSLETQNTRHDFVWLMIERSCRLSDAKYISFQELQDNVYLSTQDLQDSLDILIDTQRIHCEQRGDTTFYRSEGFRGEFEQDRWLLGAIDHIDMVFEALWMKTKQKTGLSQNDTTGGTSITFDLSPNHPHRHDVLHLLSNFRTQADDLLKKVRSYNQDHPGDATERLTFYTGQYMQVLADEKINHDP